jgi:catechol 2,3-dioxygenase-like lactoylglutathione lyase family enzyme
MNLFQVNLFAVDFPAMLAFYTERLGLATNDIDPGPPCIPGVNWASLLSGSVIIELFDAATFSDRARLQNANRDAAQLCFIVGDVTAERNRLAANGIRLDPIVTQDWGRSATFRDPEGNGLQIFEVFSHAT